jgi:TRAP transporter TAXI family solute receptor
MKKFWALLIIIIIGFLWGSLLGPMAEEQAPAVNKTAFVTIGTGGITGVYYPTGGVIAKIVNKKRKDYGIRVTVEATDGSVFNINAIISGDLEFGLVQSDTQFQAVKGLGDWKEKGPQKELRAVCSLHPETVTLLATVDSNIKKIEELRGKRVNIGNVGSGPRQNSIDALKAAGLDYESDLRAESIKPADAPAYLQDGRLDALFYTVGHPSGAFKEATVGTTKTRFIPVAGPGIEKMLAEKTYYTKSVVPIKLYPAAVNEEENVESFGVKATLCTSAKVPAEIVYVITKELFENFEEFKSQQPAYASMTKAGMLENLTAPFHPGAEKYFTEAGLLKK